MAKIKLGAIVTDIRGKLGGHVFSKNRGGSYMRTKVTPINPQSLRQSLVRSIFAVISSAWSALTDANRETYRSKVTQYGRTDIFGDLKNPSGKALHHRLNQNLALSGQAVQTECPSPIAVKSSDLVSTIFNATANTMKILSSSLAVGDKVLVFATPKLSAGTNFVKNSLRMLDKFEFSATNDIDIHAQYIAKYGSMVAGDNIRIGVKVVNVNGQASPLQTVKASFVA